MKLSKYSSHKLIIMIRLPTSLTYLCGNLYYFGKIGKIIQINKHLGSHIIPSPAWHSHASKIYMGNARNGTFCWHGPRNSFRTLCGRGYLYVQKIEMANF